MADGTSAIAAKRIELVAVIVDPRLVHGIANARAAPWITDVSATVKYKSGATITMLVILIRRKSEIAIAASKNGIRLAVVSPPQKKIETDDREAKRWDIRHE